MARRWRRWLLRGFLAAVALGTIASLTLPWWWPAILGRIDGLTVEDWKTSGWSSVELHNLTYEREGLQVEIGSLRVPAFGRWPLPSEGPAVLARDIVITPKPVVRATPLPPSAHRMVSDVLRAWPAIERWLPRARAESIEIAAGTAPVRLATASWDGTRLEVSGPLPRLEEVVNATLARPSVDTLELIVDVPSQPGRTTATVQANEERLDVEAVVAWRGNEARVTAQFGAEGVQPTGATLEAPTLTWPVVGSGVAGYGPVQGAVQAQWAGREFTIAITAAAQPDGTVADLPPLAVDMRGSGTTTAVRLESAIVRAPGIEGTLSAPVAVALPTGEPATAAEFSLAIDLARLPWVAAEGRVTGNLALSGGPGIAPAARVTLTGEGLRWRGKEILAIDVAGQWRPGFVQLERCEAQFPGDAHARITAEIDLAQSQLVASTITARLTAATVRPWVAAIPEFTGIEIDASAAGPLRRPEHSGTLRWTGLAGVPGGILDGAAEWRGEGLASIVVEGEAQSAAGITFPVEVQLTRDAAGAWTAALTRFVWRDARGEWFHLAQPARVTTDADRVAIDDLRLAGDTLTVHVAGEVRWPGAGRVSLDVNAIDGERIAALLPAGFAAARIDSGRVNATWENGPVQLDGEMRATYAPDPAAPYTVETTFGTAGGELAFGAVRVLDASGVVLEGTGRVPLTMHGRAEGFSFALPRDGDLALTLTSTPNPKFWESISRLTRWQVNAPEVRAELGGTLGAPRGRVEFTAGSVQPPPGVAGAVQLPRIGDVKLVVDAGDDGLALTEGILTLDGNWVSLRGQAPWKLWREAREQSVVPWRDTEFSFSADRMPMSIAARAVPTLLAPTGDISFSLQHAPGRGFTGFLILADAALRPLPPLGAVRDISGRLETEGYAVRLPQLGALIGGRPIAITGEASVARMDRPLFDLHLKSARVPLVRQEGLVLRAMLDLRVAQTADQPAHIAGSVNLGQSVFVSDLVALLPTGGGVAAPEQRPPYFSVREPPLAHWTLDVAVAGDKFLRIENPFFKGTISADFQLTGTLAEPRAIGRAWSERGTILFPFGTLAVEQLEISLSAQNPFEPALLATAATRILGYDVRLEASGSAADPRLLFSSNPPLSSQAVFLLLTTGDVPDSENRFSTGERTQRLALFVGRNLATSLGIGTGTGDSDRLVVRSGEDFSREGGETIHIQYNLDDRWSVVTEKDRFDAFNGGIKFRVVDR